MNFPGRRARIVAPALLVAAGLLAACGQPSSAPHEPPAVSGEPPEDRPGVRADAASRLANDDTAYLTRLGLIRGHLRVGMELYRQGEHEHAKRHMKHPADELYAELGEAFEHRGSAGFAASLDRLATLVTNDAGAADIERAYAALLSNIAAAEAHVEPSLALQPAPQIAIVVNLLETAADEYGEGVVDGRIENVHEYQDAYGFVRVALERATDARAAHAEAAAHSRLNGLVDDIQALSGLWPELVPAASVDGTAARIEAVANRYR